VGGDLTALRSHDEQEERDDEQTEIEERDHEALR
jgi:hypothetical protein